MHRSPTTLAGWALRLAGAACCVLPGCAAPEGAGRAAGAAALLYVVNSADATITRLDAASGRVIGEPLPAGPRPWRVAPGPGSLLVLSTAAAGTDDLTRVSRAGGGWAARPVALAGGARGARLAGDGGRYSAVAYHDEPGDDGGPGRRCRLALVDHVTGAVERRHTVCAGHEYVTGLALEDGPNGPVAFVAIRVSVPAAEGPGAGRPAAANRIVAVDARTGAVWATRTLADEPRHLVLAAAPGRDGRRLYAVEAPPRWDEDPSPAAGRLLGMDPGTLALEREWPLSPVPAALAISPDGEHAYALTAHLLTHLDLGSGAQRLLASLPRASAGLAVTDTRVYAADLAGREVWAVDRRRGHLVQTIPVGRRPAHLALERAG